MMYEILVPSIAAALPGKWQANNQDEGRTTNTRWDITNGPVTFSLTANQYGEKGRLVMSCQADRRTRITVSETRSSASIARDIESRFLAECIANHRKAAEYQRKRTGETLSRHDNAERLILASGNVLKEAHHQPHSGYAVNLYGDYPHRQPSIVAEVSNDSTELTFRNVPPLLAEKLVTLFSMHVQPAPEPA